MSWVGIDPELRRIIERVCTPKQIEVLKYKHAGFGARRTALVLGITRDAVRARLDAAAVRIQKEVAAMRGVDW